MPHIHRFYVEEVPQGAAEVLLPEEEAHHAARVVRIRPGEPVALLDGRGGEWTGRVARVDRRDVAVAVESARSEARPAARVTLVQAWLKRDKHIEEIVRHGTELGVARFVFFRAAHSEKTPETDPKWLRVAQESCKQCGRLWLPEFRVARDLGAALEAVEGASLLLLTLDEAPVPLSEAVREGPVALLVGPEGDFTGEEAALARERGARPVSLGPATYRSEVAAFLGAALVLYELGALGPRA